MDVRTTISEVDGFESIGTGLHQCRNPPHFFLRMPRVPEFPRVDTVRQLHQLVYGVRRSSRWQRESEGPGKGRGGR